MKTLLGGERRRDKRESSFVPRPKRRHSGGRAKPGVRALGKRRHDAFPARFRSVHYVHAPRLFKTEERLCRPKQSAESGEDKKESSFLRPKRLERNPAGGRVVRTDGCLEREGGGYARAPSSYLSDPSCASSRCSRAPPLPARLAPEKS
ncbi:hypothetical protein MRX96_048066 [Rhipicephalus microplus]